MPMQPPNIALLVLAHMADASVPHLGHPDHKRVQGSPHKVVGVVLKRHLAAVAISAVEHCKYTAVGARIPGGEGGGHAALRWGS